MEKRLGGRLLILRDFLVTLLLCYAYVFVRYHVVGHAPFNRWLLPLIDTLFYALSCWLVFVISIRLFKSKLTFAVLSWLSVGLAMALAITNAGEIQLTQRVMGYVLFTDGAISIWGVVYHLLKPYGFMALWATALLVISFFTDKQPQRR